MNPIPEPSVKLDELQLREYRRRMRRMMRYPKMRGSANPYAHRNAVFKLRYGLAEKAVD